MFDFHAKPDGSTQTKFITENIYQCKKVIHQSREQEGADWLVMQLDRSVTGREPLPVYIDSQLDAGWALTVMGHPAGLPIKFSRNGKILKNDAAEFFVTDLDTFIGNSGSPVLAKTVRGYAVVGVLSRGAYDFIDNNGCTNSRRCDDTCQGESVTRSSVLAPFASNQISRVMLKKLDPECLELACQLNSSPE